VTRSSRSLADDIRQRSDDELSRLLVRRPDLARPAPSDLTALAARSSTRASTARAVDALDLAHLQVLEAASLTSGPVESAALAHAFGGADEAVVSGLLESLWRTGLLWRAPDGLAVSRTVGEVLGPHVAGLGPSTAELDLPERSAEQLALLVAEAPPRARAILERLAAGPPVGILPQDPGSDNGVPWLLDHRLVRATAPDQVTLPREIALSLRGERLHAQPQLTPPPLEGPAVALTDVDAAAGAGASTTLELVDDLLTGWSADPPRVLRAGGLAVRDLGTLARRLDVPDAQAAFLVELAAAAGLLADDGEVEPHWAPTADFDSWQERPPAERWADLASSWLSMIRAPHLVGSRLATGDSPVNALGPDASWPPIRALRETLLELTADTAPRQLASPDGAPESVASGSTEMVTAPTTDSLAAALAWRRPRRIPRDLEALVAAVLREASWLGVTGRGALGSAGRALLVAPEDREAIAAVVAGFLPAPVDAIVLQGDLTAIAPGPVTGSIATLLRSIADIESRGGATVHRFTEQSLRRGLDAGWSADQILSELTAASRTPVPQPLDYLVRDTARRHGQVRVSSVRSCVRADDPGVLDEMEASRELGALQLRRLAPTVLTSPVAADLVLDMLRAGGFAPVAETAAGVVSLAATPSRRAGSRPAAPPMTVHTVDAAHAAALVAALRAGEASADADRARRHTRQGPSIPANDPTTSIALLREAVAAGHAVWLGYADAAGSVQRMLFYPERVDGGRVTGSADGGRRVLSIHRITGVVAG
jgi:hypothetical protein